MQYMLLIYLEEQALEEAQREKCYQESAQYAHKLHAKGQFIATAPLHPTSTATTIRTKDGKRIVTDGPYAETREQLGGYFLIDVPNLDDAIKIASEVPAGRWGTVEIRPVIQVDGLPARTAAAPTLEIDPPRYEDGRPMAIAGLRGHFTPASWAGIPAQWERLGSFMNHPAKIGAAHYGLCFQMPDGVDYLSGFEVNGAKGLPAEFSRVSIPAQHYAVFAHRGHVSKLRETLDAIWHKWLPASGHHLAHADAAAPNFFERYGEKFDPRTGMGDIEVWVPVKS